MRGQRAALGLHPVVCSGCGKRSLVLVATLLAGDPPCQGCGAVMPTAEQERADAGLQRLLQILREERRVEMTLSHRGLRNPNVSKPEFTPWRRAHPAS